MIINLPRGKTFQIIREDPRYLMKQITRRMLRYAVKHKLEDCKLAWVDDKNGKVTRLIILPRDPADAPQLMEIHSSESVTRQQVLAYVRNEYVPALTQVINEFEKTYGVDQPEDGGSSGGA